MANKIIQLNDGTDNYYPVAAVTEHSLCTFNVAETNGIYYLSYISGDGSNPFSTELIGTDYVLKMEY